MRKAENLPLSCAVVTKSGNLNFLEPSGLLYLILRLRNGSIAGVVSEYGGKTSESENKSPLAEKNKHELLKRNPVIPCYLVYSHFSTIFEKID